MRAVLRPLFDPPLEDVDLSGTERLDAGVGRRHPLRLVVGGDPCDQFALARCAGDDRALGDGTLADVETELRFPLARVGPVAAEAVVRQDRPDVAAEIDAL